MTSNLLCFGVALAGQPRYICNKEHPNQVFEFTAISDQVVTMVHRPVLAALVTIHVPFKDLLKWKLAKAKMPELLPATTAKGFASSAGAHGQR